MAALDPKLTAEIVRVAREVPAAVMESICGAIEKLPSSTAKNEITAILSGPGFAGGQNSMNQLIQSWQTKAPQLAPAQLAGLLRGASAMDDHWRRAQCLELAWTGPAAKTIWLRRTDQALLDVINEAQTDLIVVSFAVYKIPAVIEALIAAHQRGVNVKLILETAKESEGILEFDGFKILGNEILALAKFYIWPLAKRGRDEKGHHGALHAKCAVADRKLLFISSANLTEYAFNLNMEMGVLIRGGEAPAQAFDHFLSLIDENIITSFVSLKP